LPVATDLAVQVMNASRRMFRALKLPLHERLIDDDFGSYVRQFESLDE
jgi:hypothetical protein